MSKQPIALMLAEQYETGSNECEGESWCCPETAAVLRRQHAEIERLYGLLREAAPWIPGTPGTVGARANDNLRARICNALEKQQ